MSEFAKQVEAAVEQLNCQFAEFKQAQEEQMAHIARHGGPDGVLTEKIEKLNEAIGDSISLKEMNERLAALEKKANRLRRGDEKESTPEQIEHREAFQAYFKRGGHEHEQKLGELQQKAMSVGVDADGGYAVPEELDREIEQMLLEVSPMRGICMVKRVGSSDYKKLVNLHGTASGWVGETASRPGTATSQFAEVVPPIGEIYANPAATQQMLDDAFFNVESFIADEVVLEFAEQEGAAFISGNGTNRPKGFLDETIVATGDDTRAFGSLQYFPTGGAGAFAGTDPHGVLIDTVYGIKAGFRGNARWLANRRTLAEIRKMKDGDGNLLWQPGLAQGQPQMLLGYPITEAEDMPDIAANSHALAFGDFMRGYMIVDRFGTRTLRDPYTNKPYIHFYTTKRVGGKIINSDAIKVVKFAAS